MSWLRWWDGTCSDPKWRVIAARSKQPVGNVLAVWAWLLEQARPNDGELGEIDCEEVAVTYGYEIEHVEAIITAMSDKGLIEDASIKNWRKRQPKREDDTAAERKKAWKQRKEAERNALERIGTHGNAPEAEAEAEYSSGANAPSLALNDFENRSTPPDKPKPKSQKINFSFEEKRFEHIEPEHWQAWQAAYPAIDVQTCVLRAAAWLLANPNNRKQNYQKFITNWLAREQDKAPRVANGRHPPPAPQKRGYDFDVIEEQIDARRRKREQDQEFGAGDVRLLPAIASRSADLREGPDCWVEQP